MKRLLQDFLSNAFTTTNHPKSRPVFWLCAAVLLVAGGYLWGKFLNWGQGPYQYHDWIDITMPRLTFLQNAVRQNVLPLHIQDPAPLGGVTDRFLTIPDAFVSPQLILLRWLEIGPFLMLNFLLLYAAGFAGLVWFGLQKRLSAMAFSVLFLLFQFNGHLIAHISVGHFTWTAYFLFPWLLVLLFELLDGAAGRGWVLKVCLVMFVMLLQGGYHMFIWWLFLLVLLIPAVPRHAPALLHAVVFSVLTSAARTLPPALNLGRFDNRFLAGYPFFHTIWFSLTGVTVPNDYTINLSLTEQVGTWEYALFVGIPAAALLGWFGLVRVYRQREECDSYAPLLLPVLGLTLLSLNDVYRLLRVILPLPIFTGERVAARVLIVAFLLVLVLAVIQLQKWLNRQAVTPLLAALLTGALVLIGNDLWQNVHLWRIPAAAEFYLLKTADPARWAVANHPDPEYRIVLLVGAAVTLLTFAGLVYNAVRDGPHQPKCRVDE